MCTGKEDLQPSHPALLLHLGVGFLLEPVEGSRAHEAPHGFAAALDTEDAVADLGEARAVLERVGEEAVEVPEDV